MNALRLLKIPRDLYCRQIRYNLIGVLTESGIRLLWEMPDTASATNTEGYYVYRKAEGETNFVKVSTITGVNNRAYDDLNVVSERTYSYYVTAFYGSEVSSPTNYLTIKAPALPKPVLSFDAIQHARNEVELRWQNDNSQYISETRIYKHIVGVTSDYVLFKPLHQGSMIILTMILLLAKKTVYKAVHVTNLGESNPKYDFIQAPYRDISQGSPVYIKQIKFTD